MFFAILIREKGSDVHTDDSVIIVAGDMKPGAGVDKGWIPALQHIVCVLPNLPLLVQYVTFKSQQHVSEKRPNLTTMHAK
jgi:hypothetical protein